MAYKTFTLRTDVVSVDIQTMAQMSMQDYDEYLRTGLFTIDHHEILRSEPAGYPLAVTQEQVKALIGYLTEIARRSAVRTRAELALNLGFVIVATLAIVGCGSDSHKSQVPVVAEVRDCQVGDICVLRPPREADLAFANLRAYTKFRRLKAARATTAALYGDFQPFDGVNGDTFALLHGAQIRILKVGEDGIEAIVVKNERLSAVKTAGHKVWLANPTSWMAAAEGQ